jgi:transcription initiation factor IIE alpha subunit
VTIKRANGKKTSTRIRLVECPVCGEDLRYSKASSHLSKRHRPADFGLSALNKS